MSRPPFLLTPSARGWVLRSGMVRLRWFPTKHEALSYGVRLASRNRPSELLVGRSDGTIEDRRDYQVPVGAS